MALTINQDGQDDGRKPVLLNKVDNSNDRVNQAISLVREDGVIACNDDRTIKIWLKRDSGQYWPSVCHSLAAVPNCMDFSQQIGRLFVGLENGVIVEFEVSDDFNKITHIRDTYAHSSGVTCLLFSLQCEWILSCGKDKKFVWHCSETGRRLGAYQCDSWCTSLQFDSAARYAFVGDYAGHISLLRLQNSSCTLVNKLSGHAGSVRCLCWDSERQHLFSGSFDQAVIVWDIGGRKGSAFELQGHKSKVIGLAYSTSSRCLVSASDDGQLTFWDLNVSREETPMWKESDTCERCAAPFFWNVREMWTKKIVGQRQHHCRACGLAICNKCSPNRSAIPSMGFEYSVRVCEKCFKELENKDRTPLAKSFKTKQNMVCMDLNETQSRLITVGSDRILKMWDISSVLG